MRRKQSPFKCIINCIYNLDSTTMNWLLVFGPTGPVAEPVFPDSAASRFPVFPSLLRSGRLSERFLSHDRVLQWALSLPLIHPESETTPPPLRFTDSHLWQEIESVNCVGPAARRLFQTQLAQVQHFFAAALLTFPLQRSSVFFCTHHHTVGPREEYPLPVKARYFLPGPQPPELSAVCSIFRAALQLNNVPKWRHCFCVTSCSSGSTRWPHTRLYCSFPHRLVGPFI